MRKIALTVSILLTVCIAAAGVTRAADRPVPAGFGQNYNEIVALAKKEGRVRFAASDPDESGRACHLLCSLVEWCVGR